MPYKKIDNLPKSVAGHLSRHAQKIYLEAYNNAWEQYADRSKRLGKSSREETARKVAWAAVKKSYRKDDASGKWRKK